MKKSKLKEHLAAQILEDVSLTDELNDDDAQVLIKWALHQVEALAEQSEPPPEAEAIDTHLGDEVKRVRRIATYVNRLVGRRGTLDPERTQKYLDGLADLLPKADTDEAAPTRTSSAEQLDAALSNQQLIEKLLPQSLYKETPPDEQTIVEAKD